MLRGGGEDGPHKGLGVELLFAAVRLAYTPGMHEDAARCKTIRGVARSLMSVPCDGEAEV